MKKKLQQEGIELQRAEQYFNQLHGFMSEKIKSLIIDFYQLYGDEVKKIDQMLKELNRLTPNDKKRFLEIEKECESFRKLVHNFQYEQKKERLIIYSNQGYGAAIFPPVEYFKYPKAQQYWYDLWNFPAVIHQSGKKYEDLETYNIMKEEHNLVWAFGQEYNGKEVWIDLECTICDNHGWREHYGLNNLIIISINY